jgi:hypothetical protein
VPVHDQQAGSVRGRFRHHHARSLAFA